MGEGKGGGGIGRGRGRERRVRGEEGRVRGEERSGGGGGREMISKYVVDMGLFHSISIQKKSDAKAKNSQLSNHCIMWKVYRTR